MHDVALKMAMVGCEANQFKPHYEITAISCASFGSYAVLCYKTLAIYVYSKYQDPGVRNQDDRSGMKYFLRVVLDIQLVLLDFLLVWLDIQLLVLDYVLVVLDYVLVVLDFVLVVLGFVLLVLNFVLVLFDFVLVVLDIQLVVRFRICILLFHFFLFFLH